MKGARPGADEPGRVSSLQVWTRSQQQTSHRRRGEITMVRIKGTTRRVASYGVAIHFAAYACGVEPDQAEGPSRVENTPRGAGGSRSLPQWSRGTAADAEHGGFSGNLPDDEPNDSEAGAAGDRGTPPGDGGSAGVDHDAEGGAGGAPSAGMGGQEGTDGGAAGQPSEPSDAGGAAGASPGSETPNPSAGAAGSSSGVGGQLGMGGDGGRGGTSGREEPARSGRGGSTGGSGTAGNLGTSGSPASAGNSGTSGGVGSSGPLPAGDVARGQAIVIDSGCAGCHGTDLAGRGYFRNITPDVLTGIGSWSDDELALGIRKGKNKLGQTMCVHMPHYPWVDQKVADVIAYLRSIPAKANLITSVCPGHGT